MRNRIPQRLLFTLLLTSALLSEAAPLKVMIDPGHGGIDSGATRGSHKESDIALKVSRLLKDKLSQNPDFAVEMTRTGDHNISLQERVKMAERAHSDLFLSIHLNSNPDPRAKGVELYFQNHLPPDEDTYFLASNENRGPQDTLSKDDVSFDEPTKKNDISSIVEDLERHHRMLTSHQLSTQLLKAWSPTNQNVNIRQAPFYVVSRATIPSVLVELGFISNPKEAERLAADSYQSEMAEKIYQGLILYRKSLNHGVELPVSVKN